MAEKQLAEEAIFKVACRITSVEVRADYLQQVCGDDKALSGRVATLLRLHDQDEGFLESPAAGIPATLELPPVVEQPGTMIGPYKLVEELGEGGMGSVFMATQEEPVRRKVALKVIKPGMDSKQVVARFEAERQALAMMDHPNIAKVLDAGATDSGRPYFVMELVQGVPITQHCDEINLTTNERLQLFLDVCRAIQHAHLKGVIHRDIKPTNVMVTLLDGEPVPKVIDFGIAKATQKLLTEKTSLTGDGQFLGTPQYMSPEQAGMSDLDVDIRTDVYSLGVVLYELLVGSTPFDPEQLRQAGYDDMCRIIRETDPPTPSNQLSTLVAATTEVFKRRRTQPAALRKQLRGDLDCIVMKTLEKDRDDRYATVQALADDVRRHLQDVPIRARRRTLLERMIRKSRRHRAAVVVAGLVLAVIAVASIVSTALLWTERQETNRAMAVAQQERETAKQKAEEAQAITDFLVKDLFGSVDPRKAKGRKVTVDEVLANAEAKVKTAFENKPLTEAAVRHTLSGVLLSLGRYADAKANAERARALRTAHLGVEHADTLKSTASLAAVLSPQGKLEEARQLNEQVLEARQRILGPDHEDTLNSMSRLAAVLMWQGKDEEARQLNEQVLEARQRILGPDHEDTLASMHNLASVLLGQQKLEQARKLFEQALETQRRTLGEDHPNTCKMMGSLALTLAKQREFDRARELHKHVIEVERRILGPDHLETLPAMVNFFSQLRVEGRLVEAKEIGESLLEALRRILGPDNRRTLGTMNDLGVVLKDLGDLDKARQLDEQTVEATRRVLGPEHPTTLASMWNLALVLVEQGKLEEARKLHVQVLETRRRVLGPNDGATLASMANLAIVLARQEKFEEAGKLFEESLEGHRRIHGPDHPVTCKAMQNLAAFLRGQNQLDRARTLLEQVIDVQPRILGSDHPDTLRPRENLVQLLLQEGKQDEAQEQCKSLLEAFRRILGPDHPDTARMMNNLAKLLFDQGELDESLKIKEQLVETRWRVSGPCHFATFVDMGDLIVARMTQLGIADLPGFSKEADSIERAKEISPNIFFLATAYWQLGDKEEARRWYDKAAAWMDEHKPDDKDLTRFRGEAAKLIGSNGEDESPNDQED